jgi:predicted alpha/beta-fold hydrolase
LRWCAIGSRQRRSSPARAYPRFLARPPWWGGDLQTIRNYLRKPTIALDPYPAEPLEFPMADGSGDTLVATLNRPLAPESPRPLVILIHGLTGCEASTYMRASARHLLGRGHPVLRLNLRGATLAPALPPAISCRPQRGPAHRRRLHERSAGGERDRHRRFPSAATCC